MNVRVMMFLKSEKELVLNIVITLRVIKLTKMSDPNKDFKPRKLITKIILTNPSLYSLSVTPLFNPQNEAIPQIYKALEKKQQVNLAREESIISNYTSQVFSKASQVNPEKGLPRQKSIFQAPTYSQTGLDSLQKLQKQFDYSKLQKQVSGKDESTISKNNFQRSQSEQAFGLKRGTSMPSLLNFHYAKSTVIKQKQSKPFNIISNL